jgi:hypothetical protein
VPNWAAESGVPHTQLVSSQLIPSDWDLFDPEAGMLNRSLLFAAMILFTVTALEHALAVWRGSPQMLAALDQETRAWVQGPLAAR